MNKNLNELVEAAVKLSGAQQGLAYLRTRLKQQVEFSQGYWSAWSEANKRSAEGRVRQREAELADGEKRVQELEQAFLGLVRRYRD